MFTLQVGFMSPSFVGIVPSIEMVISCAVGGRDSLLGAVYGTLVVNFGKTFFSERFPQLWLFLVGALFIAVVMVFPNGLAGMNVRALRTRLAQLRQRLQGRARLGQATPAGARRSEGDVVDGAMGLSPGSTGGPALSSAEVMSK